MTSSWHYLCSSTKWLPAKLCLQCCSKCMTRSCILTHTVKVISYPPLQHPVKLPWHRLVHVSLLHTIINTGLDSSFFSLSWSVLSLCFISWDLLYFCLFWTKFCVLEFAIASLLQHKLKLTPQSHLCNHPSIVPLEALDMCALVCKCFVIHRVYLCYTRVCLCCICYKNLNTRAQTNTTQVLLLALSREIQSYKSHKQKILVSSHV